MESQHLQKLCCSQVLEREAYLDHSTFQLFCAALLQRTKGRLLQQNMLSNITLFGYADDISAAITAVLEADIQASIDVFLDEMEQYCSAAGLVMNPDKSEVVMFQQGQPTQQITAGGQPKSGTVRLLGISVDKDYKFETQVKEIENAMNYRTAKIAPIAKFLPFRRRKEVLEAIVISKARYGIEIWCKTHKSQVRIQKAMNNALRVLFQTDTDSAESMLQRARWLNAANLTRQCQCATLKRIMDTRNSPETFGYILRGFQHRYGTRFNDVVADYQPKSSIWSSSFLAQSIASYNALRLNGRLFEDYEDWKTTVHVELKMKYGNTNLY